MTLQFDPGAYAQVYEQNQNRNAQTDQQNKQLLSSSINAIPQAFLGYRQQQQAEQDKAQKAKYEQLVLGLKAGEQGYDPNAFLSSLNGPTASSSPEQPAMSQSPQPGPWSNPQQQGTPAATTGGMYANPPSPLMQPQSPVVQAWHAHPDKTQFAPQGNNPFQRPNVDYNGVLNSAKSGDYNPMFSLPQKEQGNAMKVYEFNQNQNKMPMGGPTTGTLSWDTATPTQKNMAQAMVRGDIRPGDLGMHDRATIVGLANEYAQQKSIPFQSYGGDVKKGMAENLAYGKMGQNALSLNTALGHTGDAVTAYENIKNTNSQFLNKPINILKHNSNDPNIVALELNLNALHGELTNVFKNGGSSDAEIGQWAKVLNTNLTPSQYYAAAQKVDALLRSRLSAMQYQQGNVMNQPTNERQLLSPHGAELSQRFQSMGNGQQQGGLTYQGRPLKDTPANRAWLAQQGGAQ